MNLLERLEVVTDYEVNLALPNEVFGMLLDEKEKGNIKSAVHLPFAYSYLYLTTYMYRYGKYSAWMMSSEDIKEVLGMNPKEKRVDYIVKKNGVLDNLGLTETTNNIAVGVLWFDDSIYNNKLDYVEIECLSHIKKLIGEDYEYEYYKKSLGITPRSTIKKPRFAYVRDLSIDIDDITDEDEFDGTFYDASRTHIIDFRVFDFCMNNDELGVNAFYIYSYLKHKNDLHNGYDASTARLSKELGLSSKTIQKYRDAMRKFNLINLVHNNEVYSSTEKMLAPTNYTNNVALFSKTEIAYAKFDNKKKVDKVKNMEFKYVREDDNVVMDGQLVVGKDIPLVLPKKKSTPKLKTPVEATNYTPVEIDLSLLPF